MQEVCISELKEYTAISPESPAIFLCSVLRLASNSVQPGIHKLYPVFRRFYVLVF
jgi:hypothetical protein